jgi:RecB family exonuclease
MHGDLYVFPTDLARRRYLLDQARRIGAVDARSAVTMASLERSLRSAASAAGFLSPPPAGPATLHLLRQAAARSAAREFAGRGPLGRCATRALEESLKAMDAMMAPFADDAEAVLDALDGLGPPDGRAAQLAALYRTGRETCRRFGFSDLRDVNAAILRLLRGDRSRWPARLADPDAALHFRAVRWLNPFEERWIVALQQSLGPGRVHIRSALPPALSEEFESRLDAQVRSNATPGAEEADWSAWTEALQDASAADDPLLAQGARRHLFFTRSAGLYGEMEDVGRRIQFDITEEDVAPEEIALVVPARTDTIDAARDVLERFSIPFQQRRGEPLSTHPGVKLWLAMIAFPLQRTRDRLFDILSSPSFRPEDPALAENLAPARHALRTAPLPPAIGRLDWDDAVRRLKDKRAAAGLRAALALLRPASQPESAKACAARARHLLRGIQAGPSDDLPRDRIESLLAEIESLADSVAPDCSTRDFLGILEALLEQEARPVGRSGEGVILLTPHDMAGIRCDVVYMAGLDENGFPSPIRQDALLNDPERLLLRERLRERGISVPRWGFNVCAVKRLQEEILLMTCLSAARRKVVFSAACRDEDGRPLLPGSFWLRLWRMAGWGAPGANLTIDPYDEFRMQVPERAEPLRLFYEAMRRAAPWERTASPGESLFPAVPLPLCCAPDEARQSICLWPDQTLPPAADGTPADLADATRLRDRILVEERRRRFFAGGPDATGPEPFCGWMGEEDVIQRIRDWLDRRGALSPSLLETLARCPFRFLMRAGFGLVAPRPPEDEPDPMELGLLRHRLLHWIYATLQGSSENLPERLRRELADAGLLFECRAWAAPAEGRWRRVERPAEAAFPLVAWSALDPDAVRAAARVVVAWGFSQSAQSGAAMLGDSRIWDTAKPAVRSSVMNILEADMEGAANENRFPAFFEMDFRDVPLLTSPPLRARGRIDRLDLLFDEQGFLRSLLVVDYKGPSKAGYSIPEYLRQVADCLDCQLPVYAIAAAHRMNELAGGGQRVDAGQCEALYHILDPRIDRVIDHCTGKRIRLSEPVGEGGPIALEAFRATLARLWDALRSGNASVRPLDCAWCDFRNLCRVDVNLYQQAEDRAP